MTDRINDEAQPSIERSSTSTEVVGPLTLGDLLGAANDAQSIGYTTDAYASVEKVATHPARYRIIFTQTWVI